MLQVTTFNSLVTNRERKRLILSKVFFFHHVAAEFDRWEKTLIQKIVDELCDEKLIREIVSVAGWCLCNRRTNNYPSFKIDRICNYLFTVILLYIIKMEYIIVRFDWEGCGIKGNYNRFSQFSALTFLGVIKNCVP